MTARPRNAGRGPKRKTKTGLRNPPARNQTTIIPANPGFALLWYDPRQSRKLKNYPIIAWKISDSECVPIPAIGPWDDDEVLGHVIPDGYRIGIRWPDGRVHVGPDARPVFASEGNWIEATKEDIEDQMEATAMEEAREKHETRTQQ